MGKIKSSVLMYSAIILISMVMACGGSGDSDRHFSQNDEDDLGLTHVGAQSANQVLFKDADGDGFSDGTSIVSASSVLGYCAQESLFSSEIDCNDLNKNVNPGLEEICGDGLDNNCNGLIDEECMNLNHKPLVYPASLSVDGSTDYIEQQIAAYDEDGDKLSYELISDSLGAGYQNAAMQADSGLLYLEFTHDDTETIKLSYRVSDGLIFSEPSEIEIRISAAHMQSNSAGSLTEDSQTYASFPNIGIDEELAGVGTDSMPANVDLSIDFPAAGSQGRQNSCVGWSTAYAVKTYQERVERGWSLDTTTHIFSPAFIYNQINFGRDGGAYITDALDLIVEQGVATFASMPYNENDYLTQPSQSVIDEAQNYKIKEWYAVTGINQIKSCLAKGLPVVASIKVYNSMFYLKGTDSVYNTKKTRFEFNHSVAIVGYDEQKFGGAFKIINWWGKDWGDNGFFWMPYDFFSQMANSSYVMIDDVTTIKESQAPSEDEGLPDLVIATWNTSYKQKPGGAGEFSWRVTNVGSGVTAAGAQVALILSQDKIVSSDDILLASENIRFEMQPGQSVYRDDSHAIGFYFPQTLQPGTYYMICVVDGLNQVTEINEQDNASIGRNLVTIENSLPDLYPTSWQVKWREQSGDISIVYSVKNNGLCATTNKDWTISLVLSPDETIGNGDELIVYREKAAFLMPPGSSIYRDDSTMASFNLYTTITGEAVPEGTYYMAFWIDADDYVSESNESNNVSLGYDRITVGSKSLDFEQATAQNNIFKKMYNGLQLPSKEPEGESVQINDAKLKAFKDDHAFLRIQQLKNGDEDVTCFDKMNASQNKLIYPTENAISISGTD